MNFVKPVLGCLCLAVSLGQVAEASNSAACLEAVRGTQEDRVQRTYAYLKVLALEVKDSNPQYLLLFSRIVKDPLYLDSLTRSQQSLISQLSRCLGIPARSTRGSGDALFDKYQTHVYNACGTVQPDSAHYAMAYLEKFLSSPNTVTLNWLTSELSTQCTLGLR